MLRLSLLLTMLALLGACAGTPPGTPYQPETRGFGYNETVLDDSRLLVRFTGDWNTPRNRVEASALYRAAELAQARGAERFAVLQREVETDRQTVYEVEPWGLGGFGLFGGHYSHGMGVGIGTSVWAPRTPHTRTRYRALVTVQFPDEGDDLAGRATEDTSAVLERLRPQLRLPEQ